MKSRISIWNQRSKQIPQNSPTSTGGKKVSKPNPNRDGDGGNSQQNRSYEQSTFEYEPIPRTQERVEPNLNDIEAEEGDYPPIERRGGGGILKRPQKRRHSLSVACSEEEADILRQAARDKGMTFSNWARRTLFRSAGKAIPKRPK